MNISKTFMFSFVVGVAHALHLIHKWNMHCGLFSQSSLRRGSYWAGGHISASTITPLQDSGRAIQGRSVKIECELLFQLDNCDLASTSSTTMMLIDAF